MARERGRATRLVTWAMLAAVTPAHAVLAQRSVEPAPRVRVNAFDRDAQGVLRRMVVRELEAAGIAVAEDAENELDGVRRRGSLALRLRAGGETQALRASSSSLRTLARRGARAVARALRERATTRPAEVVETIDEEPDEEDAPVSTDDEGEDDDEPPRVARHDEDDARRADDDQTRRPRSRARPAARRAPRAPAAHTAVPVAEGYDRARSSFAIYGGAESSYRRLAFRDDLFGAVSNYRLPAALALRTSGIWFPLHHAGLEGPAASLGVGGAYRRIVGLESEGPNGERLPTRSHAWNVDLWWRVPHGRHDLSVLAGYGDERFRVDAGGPTTPGSPEPPAVPAMRYRYVRIGGDAYVHLVGGLFFGAAAGFRAIVDTGALDTWFPRRRAIGFDGGLRLAYQFADVLTVRIVIDYARYSFVFDPRPGDQVIVGGASDDWLHAAIDFGIRLPEMR